MRGAPGALVILIVAPTGRWLLPDSLRAPANLAANVSVPAARCCPLARRCCPDGLWGLALALASAGLLALIA